MNLREWLIVVGIVIILGILIDGLRRMRLAKQDSLKMSRDLGGQIENTPIDDDFNPELPGGGVRVVAKGEDSSQLESEAVKEKIEPSLSLDPEPAKSDDVDRMDVDLGLNDEKLESVGSVKTKTYDASAEEVSTSEHEVLVINVDAPAGKAFSGIAIKNLLEACGMKHGDMSIFHRHEEDELSPIQFSVANAVEPGYFDPDTIEELSTPGVSFFMSVPGPNDYMKAFEFMNETAKCFAENLEGELKDENRSDLTSQTIEHYKQRIVDFERRQLCKARD